MEVAAWKAGRASIVDCHFSSAGSAGRSIANPRQRLTIGASATSASVNLPRANQSLLGEMAVEELQLLDEALGLLAEVAARASGAFFKSLNTAT